MRKRFSANKYLAFTLSLAGFAAAGMAPAFAQAATKYGSVIPYHHRADGTQAPGWYESSECAAARAGAIDQSQWL